MIATTSRLFRALTIRARIRLLYATHPVSAVISLVQVFVARGRFLRTIGLDFFTYTYIVIYVGAIAVLFLFVIMLLDTTAHGSMARVYDSNRSLYLGGAFASARMRRISVLLGSEQALGRRDRYTVYEVWNLEEVDVLPTGPVLGRHIYTTYVLDFMLRRMLLLVAIIGSIHISMAGITYAQARKSQSIYQQNTRDETKTIRLSLMAILGV
jgi:NADH-quinone oxidoreductase subunit J